MALTDVSSERALMPSIDAVAAATWPPAEAPPATILFGSTPSVLAFFRMYRIALFPSSMQSHGIFVPGQLFRIRYSALMPTNPLVAK